MDGKHPLYLHPGEDFGPPPGYKAEADAYPVVRTRRLRHSGLADLVRGMVLCMFALLAAWTLLEKISAANGQRRRADVDANAASLRKCAALRVFPDRTPPSDRETNPRWNDKTGQNGTVILRNATLFDGELWVSMPVDLVLYKGLIIDVYASGSGSGHGARVRAGARGGVVVEYDLHGQYVTPGLVDMHSHHLIQDFPQLPSAGGQDDVNEMHPDFGPLTPFVRAVDAFKAYDVSTAVIASGGVTSSLIIPGSTNIMGGEGTAVKNRVRPGRDAEYVVEDMLLEHGVPPERRNRYMKLACGENPKRLYKHTRMGLAWMLRKHLTRARALMEEQDAWCATAEASRGAVPAGLGTRFPEEAELESTVGMLRGRVAMHNHCYEAEDMETMMSISREFGFEVRAFHHATSAWQIPELLNAYSPNVTVAVWADLGFCKNEAYAANLYAGKILADHGVRFAYHSDHATSISNAKYVLYHAATAHAFGVPADLALRSVTSVPARAMDLDHRIGYARPGYDADLVVWDSHPLLVGTTPLQVFIDGVPTLNAATTNESMHGRVPDRREVGERATIPDQEREKVCARAASQKGRPNFVVHGIRRSFLDLPEGHVPTTSNLSLVIIDGQVSCLDDTTRCRAAAEAATKLDTTTTMHLADGHLAPGLTAFSEELGMREMANYDETGNGAASPQLDPLSPDSIDYAKYGVELEGKGFARARLGGVTRAVTPPLSNGGLIQGVSTAFLTGGTRRLVSGGIVKDDVALHVQLGELDHVSPGSVSLAVTKLRVLLTAALDEAGAARGEKTSNGIVAHVVNGSIPLVVAAKSTHDIEQVILLKRHLAERGATAMRVVVFGGHGAWRVAKELAEADISVILSGNRGLFDRWDTRDGLPGPPLTRSPASWLTEAGVLYALALETEFPAGTSRMHSLASEASWAAKYAGLDDQDAIRLVSRNVDDILGLDHSGDLVVWEGNPLQFGAPVLVFQAVPAPAEPSGSQLELTSCCPGGQEV